MVRLHGTILVGRLFYGGQRGFEACWVTVVHAICFHQIGMIAFIKLRHPLSFCRANCAEPWYLCVFVLSLSKNENNKGFDTIGLASFLFNYERVANIHFTVVFRIVFPSCLF